MSPGFALRLAGLMEAVSRFLSIALEGYMASYEHSLHPHIDMALNLFSLSFTLFAKPSGGAEIGLEKRSVRLCFHISTLKF